MDANGHKIYVKIRVYLCLFVVTFILYLGN